MHKDYLKAWSRIFLFPAQTRDWAGGNIHPHKVSRPLEYFGLKPRTLVSNCSSTRDGDDVEITCTVHASPAADVSKEFEENQDFLWLAHQRIQVFKLMLIGWNKKNYKKSSQNILLRWAGTETEGYFPLIRLWFRPEATDIVSFFSRLLLIDNDHWTSYHDI